MCDTTDNLTISTAATASKFAKLDVDLILCEEDEPSYYFKIVSTKRRKTFNNHDKEVNIQMHSIVNRSIGERHYQEEEKSTNTSKTWSAKVCFIIIIINTLKFMNLSFLFSS